MTTLSTSRVKVDPAEDIDVINTELALSDLDTCERAIHRVSKKAKGGDKDAKVELAALEKNACRSWKKQACCARWI